MKKIGSRTGSAKIEKVGHTSSNRYGTNENAKVKGRTTPRDLNAK